MNSKSSADPQTTAGPTRALEEWLHAFEAVLQRLTRVEDHFKESQALGPIADKKFAEAMEAWRQRNAGKSGAEPEPSPKRFDIREQAEIEAASEERDRARFDYAMLRNSLLPALRDANKDQRRWVKAFRENPGEFSDAKLIDLVQAELAPRPVEARELRPGQRAEKRAKKKPEKSRKGDVTLLQTNGKWKETVNFVEAAQYLGATRRAVEKAVTKKKIKASGAPRHRRIVVSSLLEYSPPIE